MTYADFVAALANLVVRQPTNPDFIAILPRAIEYAEQRIYRELDLEANSTRLSATTTPAIPALTAGNRNLALPAGTFVVLETVNLVTPAAVPGFSTSPDAGVRHRLVRASWDALDVIYGDGTTTGLPVYFALQDAATIAFGPWPDQAYGVEIIGTVRPAPLSAVNTTTTLSLYLPDLFLAAAMIFMSGWMRNFGQQSDNPQMASSWEAQYANLVKSAGVEEARKKALSISGDL